MIATAEKSLPPKKTSDASQPPPLENGDRLTAKEFLRRYEAMPHLKKAELIEGIVFMGSPVRADVHSEPDNIVQTWVGMYSTLTLGVQAGGNGTVRLDVDNIPQPDIFLRLVNGKSRLDEGYIVGCPELIVEIAASSVSIDLHDKMNIYRRHGAREYLAWRTLDAQFDWFVLKDEKFVSQEPDKDGIIRSTVFSGLWLDVNALLRGDRAAIWATLQKGLATPEHAAFVESLKPKTT
jgi:Uma2 family endonuclease